MTSLRWKLEATSRRDAGAAAAGVMVVVVVVVANGRVRAPDLSSRGFRSHDYADNVLVTLTFDLSDIKTI